MAGIDEWRGEPCWAKVGNAGQGGRKAGAEAKLPCSLHLQNALALPGAFLDSTDTAASSALPMDSTWKWPQQVPPGPEPLLALPPPPQTAPKRHCPSRTAGTKLPLLLHLSPFFFSWKIPPNQQPQGILLMNFTRFWPLSLWADSFGTFDGKGSVFSCLTRSKTDWVNSSAEYSNFSLSTGKA